MRTLFSTDSEIARRRREHLQKGGRLLVTLGDGQGHLEDGSDRLWARPFGGDAGTGYADTGVPFTVLAGNAIYLVEINQNVWIKWDNEEHDMVVEKPDMSHLRQTKRAATLLNPHHPQNQFVRQDNILTLRSSPLRADSFLIKLEQWIYYRASDGVSGIYEGSDAAGGTHANLEPYKPATGGYHRYALHCFNIDLHQAAANPMKIYGSTPKSKSLKLGAVDLKQCLDQAYTEGSTPIKAYRLVAGMTGVRGHRNDRDVRQYVNSNFHLVIPADFITLAMLGESVIHVATVDPSLTDDSAHGYGAGSVWINTTLSKVFVCVSAAVGAAVWTQTSNAAFANQVANTIFAGPASGVDATPTFRAMVEADIPNGIVTTAKLATDAVTQSKILDASVTTSKINDTAVTSSKLATDAVITAKLAADAVTQSKIADNAVGTAEIIDANVTAAKLATDSVTTSKIADANVTTPKIADNAITLAKMADDSVGSAEIIAGAVGTSELATDAVTTLKILNSNVTLLKLADGTPGKYIGFDPVTGAPAARDIVIDIPVIWGENVTAVGQAVCLEPFSNKWYLMSATGSSDRVGAVRGIIASIGVAGGANSAGVVRLKGLLAGFAGALTVNQPIFAAATNGALTQTEPSLAADAGQYAIAQMGWAYTSSIMFVDPKPVTFRRQTASFDPGEILQLTGYATTPSWVRPHTAWRYIYNPVLNASNPSTNRDFDMPIKGLQTSVVVDAAGAAVVALGSDASVGRRVAQSISTAVGRISQFTQNFGASVGSPAASGNTVTWTLETDSGGKPSGTLVAPGMTGTFTPTPSALNTITIAGGYQFVSGTIVWIVLTSTNWLAASNYWQVFYNATGAYGSGSLKGDPGTIATQTWNGGWASFGGTNDLRMAVTTVPYDRLAQRIVNFNIIPLQVMTIRLWMKKVGTPTGDLQIFLYSSVSNLPGSLITNGTSLTVLASSLSTGYGWVTFSFAAPPTVPPPGTDLQIVLESTSAASNTNYVQWGADVSSVSGYLMSAETGSTWSAINPPAAAIYEVYVRDTGHPEPLQEGNWTAGTGQYAYRVGDSSGDDQSRIGIFICNSVTAIDTVYVDMTLP